MVSVLGGLGYLILGYIGFVMFLQTLTLLLEYGTPRQQRIQFYGRFLAAFGCMVFCAVYGMTASIILRIAGKPGLSQWVTARSFKWTVYAACDVWFDIFEGQEYLKERPAVFVGNHQTYVQDPVKTIKHAKSIFGWTISAAELDILMLGTIFPPYCSVSAKKDLKWFPFLGWFMALSKTVFIDRTNRENALKAFENAASQMHSEKQSVYIFPEGTRSYYDHPDLLPFKKGAFHLAVQAQVPIVPIVVSNYSNVLSFKKRIFNRGRIPVKVLKPVPTKGLGAQDVDKLTTDIREMMLKEIKQLTPESGKKTKRRQPVVEPAFDGTYNAETTGADLGDPMVARK